MSRRSFSFPPSPASHHPPPATRHLSPATRHQPRLPIRWRLTLWYALLLATAMFLFAGAMYFGLRQQLYTSFDEQLLNQAALTMGAVRVEDDAPAIELSAPSVIEGEYFLRVLDASGHVVFERGATPNGVPIVAEIVKAAISGQTIYNVTRDEDGDALRIVSLPVRRPARDDAGPVVGVLQVGLDRNEIDEPLAGLLHVLALAGPLVLLLAAGGGYLLAARALAPVAAITELAARIDPRGLGARLELDLPDDELGRLARTFDAMLARIDDAFARQRQFTGDAAHELRTPLALLRGQIDLALARPRSTATYRAALHEIDGDLERLTTLVATLLTLARADAGRLVPETMPFALAATIGAVIDQFAPLATAGAIALHDESSPTPVTADESLIVQLLVNLVDNALTHTSPGGHVTIGCRGDSDVVRLWVSDTGAGIAPEHQAHIFDRFTRVDSGRGRAHGGAGLGLAICQAIVEAHGGEIALTSTVGQGTRIDVALPRGDAAP
ncbi:MAG: ATP-binding protein [Thermomicrobiales bacterium]